MSVKIRSAFTVGELVVEPYVDENGKTVKGVYRHTQKILLYGTLVYKGSVCAYFFNIYPGYVGNFASSPDVWIVQKIVPSYVQGDPVYNSGFDLHDWLYSTKGETTTGEKLTRDEVDDIASGIMEQSTTLKKNVKCVSRFRAWVMNVAVGLFAGNKRHWGNDTFKSKDMATFRIMPVARE